MFYNMLIRSLDRNPQNSGEVFQNAENRVWGRFQNVWKNIHPCVEVKISKMFQKGFKLKFLKGHFKIFHNNIFIFQPYTGLKKFLKNLHF